MKFISNQNLSDFSDSWVPVHLSFMGHNCLFRIQNEYVKINHYRQGLLFQYFNILFSLVLLINIG